MTRVLVVDDDAQLRASVVRDLTNHGLEVYSASSVEEALTRLANSGSIEVVVTDLRMTERDGIDLLSALSESYPSTRAVMMSGFATARDHQLAVDAGAVKVLCKPFKPAELLDAIRQAVDCETGFRGSVHGLSLVDVLQMFHYAGRSITVQVGSGGLPGEIHIAEGEIVHAQRGDAEGEAALQQILAMPSGQLKTEPPMPVPRSIARSFQSLLLDALRELDEAGRSDETDVEWGEFEEDNTPAASPESPREEVGMGKIDDACKEVVNSVDGAVACGVVDLDTGMLLGIHNSSSYTSTLNEVVAAATMDIFRGPNVGRIEQMVRAHRGVPENGEHYFQEVHFTSANNFHFAKTLKQGRAVMMLVTKKTTNIGMGWAQLKSALPKVEPLVP